ncbi:MAG: SIS domain-containing protein [Verrucomicrobiales bacterium]|nr:SIS domain-containing protein [Verrucomicrobiales bacterium]
MNTPETAISRYLDLLQDLIRSIDPSDIAHVAETLQEVCRNGGTVWVCGNGGSASTASHMACDLSKNTTDTDSQRLRVVSLTDNVAHFSAIANDLDYDHVFSEQLRNVMKSGDALVAISASGNSPNVVEAARYARSLETPVISLTGFSGGDLRGLATNQLHVDCSEYGQVEDLHLIFNHLLVVVLRTLLEPLQDSSPAKNTTE